MVAEILKKYFKRPLGYSADCKLFLFKKVGLDFLKLGLISESKT